MKREQKIRLEQASKDLYERMSSFEVAQMIVMLELLLADEKDILLTCGRDQFERTQGKAQAYATILDRITTPRPQVGAARSE